MTNVKCVAIDTDVYGFVVVFYKKKYKPEWYTDYTVRLAGMFLVILSNNRLNSL